MTAEIIQFIPKANPRRSTWTGSEPDPMEVLAFEIMNAVFPDTAPCEYVAPDTDSA